MTEDRFALITPATHPKHHTVGKYFASGWGGLIWYCDSYDPRLGYWMTPIDATDKEWRVVERTNVSERAIGASFHEIWIEPDGWFHTGLGGWTGHERFQYYLDAGIVKPRNAN